MLESLGFGKHIIRWTERAKNGSEIMDEMKLERLGLIAMGFEEREMKSDTQVPGLRTIPDLQRE